MSEVAHKVAELKTTIAKHTKLPVPPPKQAREDLDDIPDWMLAKNRKPLTPEQQAKVDAVMVRATAAKVASEDLRAAQKATKTEKSRVRVEKLKASKSGEAAKMPLTGKAALKAIAAADKVLAKAEAGTTPTPRNAKGQIGSKTAAKAPAKPKGAAKPVKATSGKVRAQKAPSGVRKGTKLALIVGLLTRKHGCTAAEVLAETGWPAVSMPQQARMAGIKLMQEKDGRVTRYRAA